MRVERVDLFNPIEEIPDRISPNKNAKTKSEGLTEAVWTLVNSYRAKVNSVSQHRLSVVLIILTQNDIDDERD